MNTIACPRCRGPIYFTITGPSSDSLEVAATGGIRSLRVHIRLNLLDVRRHSLCFAPSPDGEPMPIQVAA